MRLADAEQVLITSYASDGGTEDSVERVVELGDNRIGFWVADQAEVMARFSGSPVVSIRACNRRGNPDLDEPVWEGRAEVVTVGEVFDEVRVKVAEKYQLGTGWEGLVDRAKELFGGKTPEAAVVIGILA